MKRHTLMNRDTGHVSDYFVPVARSSPPATMASPAAKRQTGVTLVELLVTLTVVAILATIAVPSFGSILATSDLNAAQEDFIQILNKARATAMARSTISTVSIAGNVATLTLADSSASPVAATASNRVAINEAAIYSFNPVGTATVSSASGSTVLSTPGFAGIAPRTITVSATGIVNVSR